MIVLKKQSSHRSESKRSSTIFELHKIKNQLLEICKYMITYRGIDNI